MKTILLSLSLVLLAGIANAAPPNPSQQTYIDHMVSECAGVMGKNICRVENTGPEDFAARYPNGLLVMGVGRFTTAEYYEYVSAGDKMCDVIVRNCTADYDGRGCKMARALWRQK